MAMQLKKDEEGKPVNTEEGLNIWVGDDGKEIVPDVPKLYENLKNANGESASRRQKLKEMEQELETLKTKFEGLEDPDAAKKALETMKNLNDKQLMEAGEVEKLKANIKEGYEAQLVQTKSGYETKIKEKVEELTNKDKQIRQLVIEGAFNSSKFISENTTLTPDIAYRYFGDYFEVQLLNGKLVAVGKFNGEPILSAKENPGELASAEEAIEFLIDKYQFKDRILKGTMQSGAGFFNPDQKITDQSQSLTQVMYPSMRKK
jgi:DNA repair exonuclease SbcCD ATPase subunit